MLTIDVIKRNLLCHLLKCANNVAALVRKKKAFVEIGLTNNSQSSLNYTQLHLNLLTHQQFRERNELI